MSRPADPTEAWLRLHAAPALGPAEYTQLSARFGGADGICRTPRAELIRAGASEATAAALASPPKELASWQRWCDAPGHHLIGWDDPAYPRRLRSIAAPPLLLFCDGDPEVLDTAQIALVGSRNPTPAGRRHAHAFAEYLAEAGLVITSGLALGIDGCAHEGALAADGLTVAVTGTGPDVIYPKRHQELAERIRATGVLVTEFAPGTPPRPPHFPRRNRIIAGLSLGTLVVEAAPRSGSLITARLAAESGREVFAIPGSIENPLARGCHQLIRHGAKLVQDAADILEELAPMLDNAPAGREEPQQQRQLQSALDEDYQRLLDCIDAAPVSVDTLATRTGLPAATLSSMLLILELHGAVALAPGGGYQRST